MTEAKTNPYAAVERLVHQVRLNWRLFAGFGFLGAAAGATTAFFLPSYYQAEAAFQVEAGPLNQLGGALAGLASQLGGMQGNLQSSPQLFGDLLTTDAVLHRVIRAKFSWRGDTVSLPAVYGYDRESSLVADYYTLRKLRKAVSVNINIRTGVVRFSVEARTPALAYALAETTLAALNEANVALRQTRAATERAFSAERAEQAREELSAAESSLARFYERNRAIAGSPSLQMEEARLRRIVDMGQQIFVQLRLQEEQAAVQALRNTPAITVIDPPQVPVKRSRPNRRLAVVFGLIIGLAAAALQTSLRAVR
jgi:uncharacterized protein involved in exopolysaccharide biosynthesis